MFIRFVTTTINDCSQVFEGIFGAASDLWYEGMLYDYERECLGELFTWFNRNLKKPTRFSRTTFDRGICWFKSSATEHISKMHEMVLLLEEKGITISVIKSRNVGVIVYEDEYQVVAEPSGWLIRQMRQSFYGIKRV